MTALQCSLKSLKQNMTDSLTEWVTRSPIELSWTAKKKIQNPGPGLQKKINLVWGKLISHHAKSLKGRQVLKNHWQCIIKSCVHCILVLVTTNGLCDHREFILFQDQTFCKRQCVFKDTNYYLISLPWLHWRAMEDDSQGDPSPWSLWLRQKRLSAGIELAN